MTVGVAVKRAPRAVGLYLHLPFCASRCAYCTFVSGVSPALIDEVIDATANEVRAMAGRTRRPLASVYLGGGTPSLLPGEPLARLLATVDRVFVRTAAAEVTLEANPDDVTAARLAQWQGLGVGRLSIGVQSVDDETLALIGRRHDAVQAMRAVDAALAAGFVVSVDLIAGLPGPGAAALAASVAWVASRRPHHVSLYALELDKPHELGRRAAASPGFLPGDDEVADQLLAAWQSLGTAGYRHYEVSNFALPGFTARHNRRYWRQLPVLAAGVGAHGQAGRRRWANHDDVGRYLADVREGRPPRAWSRALGEDEARRERVMVALRTARGASAGDVARCAAAPQFAERLADFAALGHLVRRQGRVRLRRRGLLVSNELLAALW